MTHTILLADDSVTIRKVVELTFSDEDFAIVAVGDGAKALERARADRPDIVISDVIMPGLNGYELCQRIKGDPRLRGIPFLFLKGTFEGFDEERARACGADGFIVKPFEAQELVGKVKELVAAAAAATAFADAASVATAATPSPPAAPQRAEAFDFDFGDEFALPRQVESAAAVEPPSVAVPPEPDAEGGEDLWSEVSLQGRGDDVLLEPTAPSASHDWGEPAAPGDLEEPSGLVDDEAIFDEIPTSGGVAAPPPVAAAPTATPAIPLSAPAGAPLHAGTDADEIERIVAARLEAAVRQALDPLVGDLARRTVEAIAWEIIPDLAEAMIRAEIERVRRGASTD